MDMRDADEHRMSNRQKKLAPRLGQYWCGCDRAKISPGQKCPVCRRRTPKAKRRLRQ